ncbi:hypothetical protein EUTSA_v10012961mg [Eutrema salsugineum]|uniref:Zinc finger PHD-type domain-containing protein n=1 Tax=Eutrema salsugineum TaxID=72664 RepID=V4LGJ8_EUTSA|nr:hypothetical protein EUTSA_v10012961mg [Eutrema salsugineum]
MSYEGVFRKVEMDEKPYLVYTLTTQTNNSTSSCETLASVDNQPPLFFCPASRIRFQKSILKMDDYGFHIYEFLPFVSPPYFPTKTRPRSGVHKGESMLDYQEYDICKLPVVPLFWCNNEEPDSEDFSCGACEESKASGSYYACLDCENKFHKECVESPLEIRHPSHPFHPLQLYNHSTGQDWCICCGAYLQNMTYHCSTCDLRMHPISSLVCHICGLIKNLDPTYICIDCVFVIHKGCIDFPHVIRTSRHSHRISFTASLPHGELSCGVCRQPVDSRYGAYSCSKVKLDTRVWDGKDLQGVPEEDDMIDDGEPFKRIADGIILHLSHSHNLQLETMSRRAYDGNKNCLGCSLPIYEGRFYSCMEECEDFILHESCAHAPRMIRHPLDPHPLTLNFATKDYHGRNKGFFRCTACWRMSSGFAYEHLTWRSLFQLDLRCASITEPFQYQGHNHPLYLPLDPCQEATCQVCKYKGNGTKLNCSECDYIICFSCATLPYKVKYKHDSHFLKSCDGKDEANDDQPEWCEVCETKIVLEEETETGNGRKELHIFFKCDECCLALHVKCALGEDINMKPGVHTTTIQGLECQILLNNSLSRPICSGCKRRCPFPIVFNGFDTVFCSSGCVQRLHGKW